MNAKFHPSWTAPLEDYEVELAASRSGRTVEVRMYHIRHFASSIAVGPTKVTRRMLLEYVANPNWGNATKSTVRASLVSFFGWAHAQKMFPTNIAESIPKPPVVATAPRPVSKETVAAAMNAAEPRTRLMISLIVVGGLRVMEIANCNSRDVHKQGDGTYTFRAVGTNGRSRTIPLRADLAEAILDFEDGFTFPGRIGGHVSPAYVSRLVSKALPADLNAGLLRHAYKAGQITLAWREFSAFHSAKSLHLSSTAELAEHRNVQRDLDRIDQRLLSRDFGGVIEACKMLLETVFQVALDDLNQPYGKEKLPGLFSKVSTALAHTGSRPVREATVKTLRTFNSIIDSVAETRNEVDGHGGSTVVVVTERHARLVFNSTVAIAEYVADSWKPTGETG